MKQRRPPRRKNHQPDGEGAGGPTLSVAPAV